MMKTSRYYYISLYIIVPVILSGIAVLSAILAFQLAGYQLTQRAVDISGPFLLWVLSIGAVTFLCSWLLVWLLLRPSNLFVQRASQLPILSGQVKPREERSKGDELQHFTRIFEQVTDVLSKVDARRLFPEFIGESRAIRGVLSQVMKVANTDATVLILGESGTGKEMVATSIFRHSQRSNRPFVKLNCAAMPVDLLESELFGHEKGAFTGAVSLKQGKFEIADGGTLFMDEIGDMPLQLQSKILRVLQEREFDRVGGNKPIRVDVRFIAATNKNLEQMVAEGSFREDLYFRLNVFSISMPPLREHKEDIPILVESYLEKSGKSIRFEDTALTLLMGYEWPGNIRELQNVVERAILLCNNQNIGPDQLPSIITRGVASRCVEQKGAGSGDSIDERLKKMEIGMIVDALKNTQGVQVKAAELLGINQRSLWHRIKKYGIDVSEIKNDNF